MPGACAGASTLAIQAYGGPPCRMRTGGTAVPSGPVSVSCASTKLVGALAPLPLSGGVYPR